MGAETEVYETIKELATEVSGISHGFSHKTN